GVGPVLSDPGDLNQHGVSVGVKDTGDERVVFGGVPVAGEVGESPFGGFAVVGDAGEGRRDLDEVAHLAADLAPARVGVAYQYGGTGAEIGEGDVVAHLEAVRALHTGEHRREARGGHEIAAADELVGKRDEVIHARGSGAGFEAVDGNIGGAEDDRGGAL